MITQVCLPSFIAGAHVAQARPFRETLRGTRLEADSWLIVPQHQWQVNPFCLTQHRKEREVIYSGSNKVADSINRAGYAVL